MNLIVYGEVLCESEKSYCVPTPLEAWNLCRFYSLINNSVDSKAPKDLFCLSKMVLISYSVMWIDITPDLQAYLQRR